MGYTERAYLEGSSFLRPTLKMLSLCYHLIKHSEAAGLDWSQTAAVYWVQQASSAKGNRQAQTQVDLPLFGGL